MDGCGVAIRVADQPGCYKNTLASTFLLQYCVGGVCNGGTSSADVAVRSINASTHEEVEGAVADLTRRGASGMVNVNVDARTASTRSLEALGIHVRRDASCWQKGASYTRLGPDSSVR
jgi:hypothetical protein